MIGPHMKWSSGEPVVGHTIDSLDIIVCDLDGTLCDHGHREHFARHAVKSNDPSLWLLYFDAARHDQPHRHIKMLVEKMAESHVIAFITGRDERYRDDTIEWIRGHTNLVRFMLSMYPADGPLPPSKRSEWKFSIVAAIAAVQRVTFCLEDHVGTAHFLRQAAPVLLTMPVVITPS